MTRKSQIWQKKNFSFDLSWIANGTRFFMMSYGRSPMDNTQCLSPLGHTRMKTVSCKCDHGHSPMDNTQCLSPWPCGSLWLRVACRPCSTIMRWIFICLWRKKRTMRKNEKKKMLSSEKKEKLNSEKRQIKTYFVE